MSLIEYYRQKYCTVILPTGDKTEVEVDDVYVTQLLQEKYSYFDWRARLVTAYQLIGKFMGNICLNVTGPAGIGKSMLCKHVCSTWCQAHDPCDLKANKYRPEDIKTMKNFDFLFLVNGDIDTIKQFNILFCDSSLCGVNVKKHSCLFLIDDVDSKQALPGILLALKIGFEINKGHCTFIVTSDQPTLSSCPFPCRSVVMQNIDSQSSAELVTKTTRILTNRYMHKPNVSVENFDKYLAFSGVHRNQLLPKLIIEKICEWYKNC